MIQLELNARSVPWCYAESYECRYRAGCLAALQGKEPKQEMGNNHKGTFLDNLMPKGSNTLDKISKDLEVSALIKLLTSRFISLHIANYTQNEYFIYL